MARRTSYRYALILLFLLIPGIVFSAPPSRVYTYTDGATIEASEVTANEDAIFNYLTRGVDTFASTLTTDNILDGTLENADISGTAAIAATKIADGTISNTEFQYLNGVTSAIQTQLNALLHADGTVPLTANWDVGTFEVRANTFQSDVATGTAPFIVASTTKVTNLGADTIDTYDTSTTAVASKIPVMGTNGYMPDDSVDTTALKTAMSAVTVSANSDTITLPGGTYGFYPQIKATGACRFSILGVSADADPGTTYVTNIGCNLAGGVTAYVQQRYVTASGEDWWVFILVNKKTNKIEQVYSAADHPSYGCGGEIEDMPHPFRGYDKEKSFIVLIDNDSIKEIQSRVTRKKDFVTLVNEEYEVGKVDQPYIPLHTGKYLIRKSSGEIIDYNPVGEDLKDFSQVKQMVEKLPDYIKVRKLIKK